MQFWKEVNGLDRRDYCVWQLEDQDCGLDALKALFPNAEADANNFVIFSTSGVHGSYTTIEEAQQYSGSGVTFMVMQPRLVLTRYGVAYPKSEEDFYFLKKLRDTSWKTMSLIGRFNPS